MVYYNENDPTTTEPALSCKGCGQTKPLLAFRKHNRGGYRRTCRECENRWVRTTKPWSSDSKRSYQRKRRSTNRGFALVADAKRRAKAKGIPFTLDWREIQRRIDIGVCELTGIPFDLTTPKSWNAPSLDQIVPKMGYTPDNTRVVLHAVNVMACDWGTERIVQIAAALVARGVHKAVAA